MKRNNIILAGILFTVFIIGLTGFVLADPQASEGSMEDHMKDRMVGVLVTTDSLDLFDFESYFNENANKVLKGNQIINSGAYDGRIYATLEDESLTNVKTGATVIHQKFVFNDIDGFSYFTAKIQDENRDYKSTHLDDAITAGKTHFEYTDDGIGVELEGTIYVTPTRQNYIFYMNPVYQNENGDVYVMQGSAISGNMDMEGTVFSQTLESSYIVTENDKTKTDTITVRISISALYEPVNIEIIEFDKNNEIVEIHKYTAGEVPKTIKSQTETEYIFVITKKNNPHDGLVYSRELYQKDDTGFNTFYSRDDGICINQYTELIWE